MSSPLIHLTEKGLYCEAGGFYIDPTRGVEKAVITHAHSDHARRGSKYYYCVNRSRRLLERRLGSQAVIEAVSYGTILELGATRVSFHPAGHILGSAQIRVEHQGEVWVVSGDFKREPDPTCDPFESLPCDVFITEATFGSPAYRWDSTQETVSRIHRWWEKNRLEGKNSLLYCYALGKTQRVLAELLSHTDRRVLLFGEAHDLTDCYRAEGIQMIPTERLEEVSETEGNLQGELILSPHSITRSPCMERLGNVRTAFASGWMRTGAFGARQRYDEGFVLSDHADWQGLVQTALETGAPEIQIHASGSGGNTLAKHLRALGLDAHVLSPHQIRKPRERSPVQQDLFFSR